MSFLRDLLDAKEPLFDESLKQLEAASHKQGVDAALAGEIHQKAALAMKRLKLDPKDTTGRELYHALNALVKKDDEHLAKSIGGSYNMSVTDLLPLMKAAADKVKTPRDCWVLKKSVAKEMLRHMPPPSIMQRLGYKSIDSMLKRENLAEIYGAQNNARERNRVLDRYLVFRPQSIQFRLLKQSGASR